MIASFPSAQRKTPVTERSRGHHAGMKNPRTGRSRGRIEEKLLRRALQTHPVATESELGSPAMGRHERHDRCSSCLLLIRAEDLKAVASSRRMTDARTPCQRPCKDFHTFHSASSIGIFGCRFSPVVDEASSRRYIWGCHRMGDRRRVPPPRPRGIRSAVRRAVRCR